MNTLCHINLARGFRGGERQTELLIHGLAGHGLQQTLVVRRGQPLGRRLRDVSGLHIIEIGKPFVRHLFALQGDLLHAHDNKGAHLAYWARRLRGTPYVITRRVDNRPGASVLTRAMYARAQGVAALSRAIAAVMQSYAPTSPVRIIPSACAHLPSDTARAAKLRSAWGGEFVVGQIAALDDAQKGQRYLIEAARELSAEQPGWRFVLVGSGADEADLRARSADLANVTFTGHVDDVGDYFAALDVFALPSLHEGLGSSLLDAMEFGLPIVASTVDGIPEIVSDREQGLLVPPADAAALAAALRGLRQDPALRQSLGAAGRVRVQQFSADIMVERYLRWYAELGFGIGA